MTVILLTNDDGIEAEGLKALQKALKDLAHLVVVAPDEERSAVSHGLTLRTELRLKEIRPDQYVLNGTPADCVIYALRHLFVHPPDLVLSGINHGANLGDDIMYSGTVAGAREAARHGVPSIALSQAYFDGQAIRFKHGAAYARKMVESLIHHGLGGELCLNVNFPVRKISRTKITRQGCAEHMPHFNSLDRKSDYAEAPSTPPGSMKTDYLSDRRAIMDEYVSVTPLQRDQTDYAAARSLLREAEKLFPSK